MKFSKKTKIILIVLTAVILLPILLYNILLSDFAIRAWILPIVCKSAGYEIKAEECSVSLFSTPTASIRMLSVKKSGELDLQLGKLTANAAVWPAVFGENLHIAKVDLDRLDVKYIVADKKRSQAVTGEAKSAMPSQPAPTKAAKSMPLTLPLSIGEANLRDINVAVTADDTRLSIVNGTIQLKNLLPGQTVSLSLDTLLAASTEEMRVKQFPTRLELSAALPDQGILPRSILLNLNAGPAELSGENLKPTPATLLLALNAELPAGDELKITEAMLKFTVSDKPLLAAHCKGDLNWIKFTGSLKSQLTAGKSPILDALLTNLTGQDIDDFLLTSAFQLQFDQEKELVADGTFHFDAKGLPFQALDSSLKIRGTADPKQHQVLVRHFELNVQDTEKVIDLKLQLQKMLTIVSCNTRACLQNLDILLTGKQLNLPALAARIGKESDLPLKSGELDFSIAARTPEWPGAIQTDGKLQFRNLQSTFGDRKVPPADAAIQFAVGLEPQMTGVLLNELNIDLTSSRQNAGRITVTGTWPLSSESTFQRSLHAHIADISGKTLNALPFAAIQKLAIKDFSADGSVQFLPDQPEGGSLNGKFLISGLKLYRYPAVVSTELGWQLFYTAEKFQIADFSTKMTANRLPILDLNARGSYARAEKLPLKFDINSTYIDAEQLQKFAAALNAPEQTPQVASDAPATTAPVPTATTTPTPEPKEPAPFSLAPYNGDIKLSFKRIDYTRNLQLSLLGPITIRENQIKLANWLMTVNQAPIRLNAMLDTGTSDGYPFALQTRIEKLQIAPLLEVASPGAGQKAGGEITTAAIDFSGRGWSGDRLLTNSNGKVSFQTANLSFPMEAANTVELVNVIFLPIEALVQASEKLQTSQLLPELTNARGTITGILSGDANFELAQGTGNILLRDGIVDIENIVFTGGTLTEEQLSGKINLQNRAIKFNSAIYLGKVIVPLDINGTLDKPQPDYAKFLLQFAGENLKDALQPKNIENTLQTIDSIINIFKK